MELRTNHIVFDISQFEESRRESYTPIPKYLQAEAERELAGKDSVYLNPNTAKNLAAWAKKKRAKAGIKAKAARASRKRNRQC